MPGFYSNIPKQICRASPNPSPISNPYPNPDPNPSSPHYSNLERVIVSSSVAKSGEVGSRSSQEFSSWLRWMMMFVGVARRMKVGVGVGDFPEPGTFRASSDDCDGHKSQRLMKNACDSAGSYVLWLVEFLRPTVVVQVVVKVASHHCHRLLN